MFIHVPAAWMSLSSSIAAASAAASFVGLVFRHPLADAAARAAAPSALASPFLAPRHGSSLWGRPMWGTWWVWDARLTSVLILFLFYLGYQAPEAAIDDEQRAARACAILALVGVVNLPIVHFSVSWWNTLHQGSSVFRMPGGPAHAAGLFLAPLLILVLAYVDRLQRPSLVRIRSRKFKAAPGRRSWRGKQPGEARCWISAAGKYAVFVCPATKGRRR